MLKPNETFVKHGYYPESLSGGSNKTIILQCDYCNVDYESSNKRRRLSYKKMDTDACKKCKYVKREAIELRDYGCTNAGARQAVKDKIKATNQARYGVDSVTQTKNFKDKTAKTNLERYGSVNAMQSKEVQEKHKQAIRDKYGVDNVSEIKEAQEKRLQTCKEKFGSETFMSSEIGRQKLQEGVKKKFGVDNVFQAEEIKDKIKESHLKNLGVEYPMQSEDIKEKSKTTVQERYGVDNVAKCEEFKERAKETNLEKYGTEYPTQSKEIKDKIKATNLEKYGVEYGFSNSNIRKSGNDTKIDRNTIKVYNGKGMREWADELGKAYTTFVVHVRDYGFETAIKMPTYCNGLEAKISMWLDEIGIDYIPHAKIDNRFCDFKIDNLVIELDGLYWHCDRVIKDNNYHINKKRLYDSKGHKSLFFREHEVNLQLDIVKSMILNRLGKGNRIFARKCKFEIADKKLAQNFYKANHLMGVGSGIPYALTYQGDIVSLMQIKRIKDRHYEISRFCSTLNTNIVGGFSKILANMEKIVEMDSLKTFIDCRYGAGTYLPKFGFEKKTCHKSFKWVNGQMVFNRMRFPGNSGYENGYFKIWDCGQTKYVKEYNV